jgi:hypothetical protein
MRSRIAIVLASTLTSVLAVSALSCASASAAEQPGVPSQGAPGCAFVFFNVSFGQGVEAFCSAAPGTYEVFAQCSNGVDFSSVPGTLAVANSAPSVAECRGGLLASAQIISYYVVQ